MIHLLFATFPFVPPFVCLSQPLSVPWASNQAPQVGFRRIHLTFFFPSFLPSFLFTFLSDNFSEKSLFTRFLRFLESKSIIIAWNKSNVFKIFNKASSIPYKQHCRTTLDEKKTLLLSNLVFWLKLTSFGHEI